MKILTITNKRSSRPSLMSLLEQYKVMERQNMLSDFGYTRESVRAYMRQYGYEPSEDEIDYILSSNGSFLLDDDDDVIYPYTSHKNKKKKSTVKHKVDRKSKSSKKKNKETEYEELDLELSDVPSIKFYPDIYSDKSFIRMGSYYELDEYCMDNNIDIDVATMSRIMSETSFCCCAVPTTYDNSKKQLLIANSYTDLRWDAAVTKSELFNEVSL